MRLSEKTIELTFCSQASLAMRRNIIWFGLTQRQEARAGYDVFTIIGGRLILLQFKASNRIMRRTGERRFHAPHHQMNALQRRTHWQNSVFYVLPSIGTVRELVRNPNLLVQSWLLDVAALPPIFPPQTRWGTPRQNGIHYIDMKMRPPSVSIRSDPINVPLINAQTFFQEYIYASQNVIRSIEGGFEEFWNICKEFKRNAIGAIILGSHLE